MSETLAYEIREVEPAFRGYFAVDRFHLRVGRFQGGWGEWMSREVFRIGKAVGVLLYDPHADKVVLVEQFRMAAYLNGKHEWLLECVAGLADKKGEPSEDLARRESLEEAGCRVSRLELATEYFASPGGTDEMMSLFVGEVDSSEAGGIFGLENENENIRVHVLTLDEAMKMLDENKILNVTLQVALLWFARNGAKLRQRWLASPTS